MRGLALFISDIRKCESKDDEVRRINKELGKIRSKFKGDKPLNGYHKKKYVCKLLFMFLCGHKCDFGHMEAVNLLSSNRFSEKKIGYLFISIIMKEENEYSPLIINSLKSDLSSSDMNVQNLALQFISNNANKSMSESVGSQVFQTLLSIYTTASVKQTAVLALLQLLRVTPDLISSNHSTGCLVHLLYHHNLGLVMASVNLVEWLASEYTRRFDFCVKPAVIRLGRLICNPSTDIVDYTYNDMAAPWLVIKLLRILQKYPAPTDLSLRTRLTETLGFILNKIPIPDNKMNFENYNVSYAVIFEAIYTIIETNIDCCLMTKAISILGSSLRHNDPNISFITLDVLAELSNRADLHEKIYIHWKSILKNSISRRDISLKRLAFNILYNICNETNVKVIVADMMLFLKDEGEIGEEVVLKLAALVQKFIVDIKWFVDIVFTILDVCAVNINSKLWYALVNVAILNHTIHEYAARTSFRYLHLNPCPENVVKVAGYILGELGYIISKNPHSNCFKQLSILQEQYSKCSSSTRALLLTTYIKFLNMYPELKETIISIFKEECNIRSQDVEVQQRAAEYLALSQVAPINLFVGGLNKMPPRNREEPLSLVVQSKNTADSMRFQTTPKITVISNMAKMDENLCDQINEYPRDGSHLDLLHLGTSPNKTLLVDILGETPVLPKICSTIPVLIPALPSEEISSKYPASLSDKAIHAAPFDVAHILFEDDFLKIFMKSEFQKQYGRINLLYVNKSQQLLANFEVLGSFEGLNEKCSIWFKPIRADFQTGQSMTQDIQVECLCAFTEKASLRLMFNDAGNLKSMNVALPLTMNSFLVPCIMPPVLFRERWNILVRPGYQITKEFEAKFPMMYEETKTKLRDFHLAVIENVAENVQDIYCAAIFFSRMCNVGFLLKLERLSADKKYRLVVRSRQSSFAHHMCNLLSEIL